MGTLGGGLEAEAESGFFQELKYENTGEVSVANANDLNNPKILQLFTFNKDGISPAMALAMLNRTIIGRCIVDAGLNSIFFGLIRSTDGGVSWSEVTSIAFSGSLGSLQANIRSDGVGSIAANTTHLAIAVWNTLADTNGRFRKLKLSVNILVPAGHSVT